MADDIKQRIIASAFSKRSPSGALEEQYIAHVKIYEDAAPGNDDGGKKARYILLSRQYIFVCSRETIVNSSTSLTQGAGSDPQVEREYEWLVFDWENVGSERVDRIGSPWGMCIRSFTPGLKIYCSALRVSKLLLRGGTDGRRRVGRIKRRF